MLFFSSSALSQSLPSLMQVINSESYTYIPTVILCMKNLDGNIVALKVKLTDEDLKETGSRYVKKMLLL